MSPKTNIKCICWLIKWLWWSRCIGATKKKIKILTVHFSRMHHNAVHTFLSWSFVNCFVRIFINEILCAFFMILVLKWNSIHPSILLALQPWVSLGLLDNQSPLLPILRLLCPLSYLHCPQICYNIQFPGLFRQQWFPILPRLVVRFLDRLIFYGVGLLAPRPTPNLEDQGIPFRQGVVTLDLSGMGGPTSSICYCQHSSQDHVTTQAPPLRQIRNTFDGEWNSISTLFRNFWCSACFRFI